MCLLQPGIIFSFLYGKEGVELKSICACSFCIYPQESTETFCNKDLAVMLHLCSMFALRIGSLYFSQQFIGYLPGDVKLLSFSNVTDDFSEDREYWDVDMLKGSWFFRRNYTSSAFLLVICASALPSRVEFIKLSGSKPVGEPLKHATCVGRKKNQTTFCALVWPRLLVQLRTSWTFTATSWKTLYWTKWKVSWKNSLVWKHTVPVPWYSSVPE